jgi:hypothetical protein
MIASERDDAPSLHGLAPARNSSSTRAGQIQGCVNGGASIVGGMLEVFLVKTNCPVQRRSVVSFVAIAALARRGQRFHCDGSNERGEQHSA